MIRGSSSLVRSAGVSAPPGRYEDNPLQFIPLVSLSNHLKCTIESDSSWLHLLVGTPNQLVSLKVRSRVTQRCPRRVSYRNDGSGVFHRCAVGLVLFVAEGYPVVRKLSSSEQTRDKVRRRFTLSVTARVGGTIGQAPMLLVDLAAVVDRDSPK